MNSLVWRWGVGSGGAALGPGVVSLYHTTPETIPYTELTHWRGLIVHPRAREPGGGEGGGGEGDGGEGGGSIAASVAAASVAGRRPRAAWRLGSPAGRLMRVWVVGGPGFKKKPLLLTETTTTTATTTTTITTSHFHHHEQHAAYSINTTMATTPHSPQPLNPTKPRDKYLAYFVPWVPYR